MKLCFDYEVAFDFATYGGLLYPTGVAGWKYQVEPLFERTSALTPIAFMHFITSYLPQLIVAPKAHRRITIGDAV